MFYCPYPLSRSCLCNCYFPPGGVSSSVQISKGKVTISKSVMNVLYNDICINVGFCFVEW